MASTHVGRWSALGWRAAGRGRRAFRRWRRRRPFWGGLFTALGGAEILLLPVANLPVTIQVGIAGISGVIAGVLLVVLGLSLWFAPHYRVFAGIAAILIALASFLTSNLGGFLLGMLLGLLGGSLGCAWAPVRPRPTPAADPADITGPAPNDDPVDTADAPTEPVERTEPTEPVRAAPEAPEPTGTPAVEPDVHPVSDATAPAGSGSGPADGSGPRLPLAGLLLFALVGGMLAASLVAVPRTGPRPRLAAADLPVVNALVPAMHADTADMFGLSFDGVVPVPTANGPLRTLKFSMSRVVMRNYTLDVPGGPGAGPFGLSIGTLTLASDVSFYTTRMSGRLFGAVPVTFTPDAPPPLVTPITTFTDFSSAQVFVQSGTLTAAGLVERPNTT